MLGIGGFNGQGYPDCFITDNSKAERKALQSTWPQSALFLCIFHILQQVWHWLCDSAHSIKKEHRPKLMSVAKELVYANSESEFLQLWSKFCQTSEALLYENYRK